MYRHKRQQYGTFNLIQFASLVKVACISILLVLFYNLMKNNEDPYQTDDGATKQIAKNQGPVRFQRKSYQGSSWIGEQWIPPKNMQIYRPEEIRSRLNESSKGILFLGDAFARLAYETLFDIVNATDLSNIPLYDFDHESGGRKVPSELEIIGESLHCKDDGIHVDSCRLVGVQNVPMVEPEKKNGTSYFSSPLRMDYKEASCFRDILSLVRSTMSKKYVESQYWLVVISVGSHDLRQDGKCSEIKGEELEVAKQAIESLSLLEMGTMEEGAVIIWSTMNHEQGGAKDWNRFMAQRIDKARKNMGRLRRLALIDWGRISSPLREKRRETFVGVFAFIQVLINEIF